MKERRVKGRVGIARNIDLATDIDEKEEGQKASDDQVSHASDEGAVETGIEDQGEEDVYVVLKSQRQEELGPDTKVTSIPVS